MIGKLHKAAWYSMLVAGLASSAIAGSRVTLSVSPLGSGDRVVITNVLNDFTTRIVGPSPVFVTTNDLSTSAYMLLTALPAVGREFREWEAVSVPADFDLDALKYNNPMMVMGPSLGGPTNLSLRAKFVAPVTLQVRANFGAYGNVSITNATDRKGYGPATNVYDRSASLNDQITIEAFPKAGFVFKRWTGDIPAGKETVRRVSFVANGNNLYIEAVFEIESTITVEANNGTYGRVSITNTTDRRLYGPSTLAIDPSANKDDAVTIEAIPNAGYVFSRWTGQIPVGKEYARKASFQAPGTNLNITAVFTSPPLVLAQANPVLGGRVMVSNATTHVKSEGSSASVGAILGDVMALQATPSNGYYFVQWTGNIPAGLTQSATVSFSANGSNMNITAQFDTSPVITVQAQSNGTVWASNQFTHVVYGPAALVMLTGVSKGQTLVIEGRPNAGYVFDTWSGDVPPSLAKAPRATIQASGNSMNIVASFAPPPKIVVAVNEPLYGDVVITNITTSYRQGPADTVTDPRALNGNEIVLSAIPASALYRFLRWQGGVPAGLEQQNPLRFATDGTTRNVLAYFAEPSARVTVTVLTGTGQPGEGTGQALAQNTTLGITDGPGNPVVVATDTNNVLILTALPDAGSSFFEWSGNVPTNLVNVNPLTLVSDGSTWDIQVLFSTGDLDGDGMPDTWEKGNGLDPKSPLDANLDPDLDGLVNLDEYTNNTNPNNPDTDKDKLRDGWEVFYALDPLSGAGIYGGTGNPDGDYAYNVNSGNPSVPFTNGAEYAEFVVRYGSEDITTSLFAAMRLSTNPTDPDTDDDGLLDGWEVAYALDPLSAVADNGTNGNPDGDRRYLTTPENVLSGKDIDNYRNIDEFTRMPGDPAEIQVVNAYGATVTNYARTTDPLDPDTDEDGLPDGWENDFALDPLNPGPNNGPMGPGGNPDGDQTYVYASGAPNGDFNNLNEFNANAMRNSTTHPTNADVDGDRMPDHWEITFSGNGVNYDPWYADTDRNGTQDGNENPDGDYMADDGAGNIHNACYVANGYNPYTSWGPNYQQIWQYLTGQVTATPNTRAFSNWDECFNAPAPTCPRDNDSDDDGMWDGWEWYVGLNPQNGPNGVNNPNGGGHDPDLDGISNREEFGGAYNGCQTLTDASWENKIYPSDPRNPDTDGDQMPENWEKAGFKYNNAAGWSGHCYQGGGLNPCTADTDGDHIPDAWEHSFAATVDGSVDDPMADPDDDRIVNYQEYWCNAVYHWQYDVWAPGQGAGGYDPFDFFMQGQPFDWDWHFFADVDIHRAAAVIPFNYCLGVVQPTKVWFSSTDPGDWDSDGDLMDDYYEAYHGLNPLFGTYDLVLSRDAGGFVQSLLLPPYDVRVQPYINGHQILDSDQDGLPNVDESIQPGENAPAFYHSDPSPLWITDTGYEQSWVNLYYWRGTVPWYFNDDWMDAAMMFPPPWPLYLYSYEINEGFDTDNDNLGDRAELVDTTSRGATDPVDSESPPARRALYLNGDAAARTMISQAFGSLNFRSFTVEAWVRPSRPGTGVEQVIVERPLEVPNGNPMGWPNSIRLNFRLALDEQGLPYVAYDGSGFDPLFVQAKAPPSRRLTTNTWAHLAGVYDGAAGMLSLYINGIPVQSVPSRERPANGYFDSEAPTVYAAPIIIGAHENSPGAVPAGASIFAVPTSAPIPTNSQTQLSNFFAGWVDEVRVWDEAKAQGAVAQSMFRHMRRQEVADQFTLFYQYSFDDLPDPDHDPVSPQGFSLLNGRPNDGSYPGVQWWRTYKDRSLVYNDYMYIPWIESAGSHLPLAMPQDSGYYGWSETSTTVVDIEGGETNIHVAALYPNSSDPYNFTYIHVNDGDSGTLYNDLLPLRFAKADQDVPLWDLDTIGTDPIDPDGDGMPTWWEINFGLDPYDGNTRNGDMGDPDLDGLYNLYEYYAGTNPNSQDTDGDGRTDAKADSDGDGLNNLYEQGVATMPNLADTDDDGVTDGEELTGSDNFNGLVTAQVATGFSDPLNSLDPVVPRSLYFNGASRMVVPPQNKLMTDKWTIEMWVNPDVGSSGGVLISRYVADSVLGGFGINYEMGLEPLGGTLLRPYVRFQPKGEAEVRLNGIESGDVVVAPGFGMQVPVGKWTHLASTYDPESNRLELYVDGVLIAYRVDATTTPPTVFGPYNNHLNDEVTVGASRSTGAIANGYRGYIDELRTYNQVRTADEIAANWNVPQNMVQRGGPFAIPFKSGAVQPAPGTAATLAQLPADQVVHAIVQFHAQVTDVQLAALRGEGLEVVSRAAATAVTVKGPAGKVRTLAGARWSGLLPVDKKISKLLAARLRGDGSQPVLVRFHRGTPEVQAVAAAVAAGLKLHRPGYLAATDILADATAAQVNQIALADDVEYIIPATRALVQGPARLVDSEEIGVDGLPLARYTTLGDGWDGPGLGQANLSYFFINGTTKIEGDGEQEAIIYAMNLWSTVAAITWREADAPGLPYSIDYNFAAIDGAGGVLGYAYFPMVGDVTFDQAEAWGNGSPTDLRAVAVHELGHSLGLGHSDDPTAIMFPYLGPAALLAPDDIAGIQTLYGKPGQPGANFRFDDGGKMVEDFSEVRDWENNWVHAAKLEGAVVVPNKVPNLNGDRDGDKLPDWWELAYGLDPVIPDGDDGATGDLDGDGLNNLGEFYAGTNPNAADSNLNGIADGHDDSDKDGLSNADEMNVFNTHPGRWDTDDDTESDSREIDYKTPKSGRFVTSPSYSRSPIVQRSLVLNGTSVPVPAGTDPRTDRFADMQEWSLEAWVYLDGATETGAVLERVAASGKKTMALTINANKPNVEFMTEAGTTLRAATSVPALPARTWVHLVGVWSDARDSLSLFVNGTVYASLVTLERPAVGIGHVTLGRGLHGRLDQAVVWNTALDAATIADLMYVFPRAVTAPANTGTNALAYTSYGIFVGINEYATAYGPSPLNACVNDANDMRATLLKDTVQWNAANCTTLTDSGATKAVIQAELRRKAQQARAGDLVVYFHSSHGGQVNGLDTLICTHDADYNDFEFANDLTNFADNVRMIMVIDTCNSGGMFKSVDGKPVWEFAQRVNERLAQIAPRNRDGTIRAPQVGWITAADYNEFSVEFGRNGLFTRYVLEAFQKGDANGDGLISFYELYAYAYPRALAEYAGQHAQFLNEPLLRASRAAAGTGGPIAWYPFDDGGVTAEDFVHALDWDYALTNVVFDAANYVRLIHEQDSDDNGMPNWYENLFFGGAGNATDDVDTDGLNNLYEYYADTNPRDVDTDDDGVRDGDEDPDGDSLPNAEEQGAAVHPMLADTDDDGLADGMEVTNWTDPADAASPLVRRSLELGGSAGDYVSLPNSPRFALKNWSIEAWICPSNNWTGNGTILARQIEAGTPNYFLSVDATRKLTGGFSAHKLTGARAIVCDGKTWTHVQMSFNDDLNEMKLYVNFVEDGRAVYTDTPRVGGVGPVWQRIGMGFAGLIDEVRVWSTPTAPTAVTLRGDEGTLVAYYRFDDGTAFRAGSTGTSGFAPWLWGQVEDFDTNVAKDWPNEWFNAGTLAGKTAFVRYNTLWMPVLGNDTDSDFLPDAWEEQYPNRLNPLVYDSQRDPDGDGWSNLAELMVAGTAQGLPTSPELNTAYPLPPLSFTFKYVGYNAGQTIHIEAFNTNSMDGVPSATVDIDVGAVDWTMPYTVTIPAWDTGHLREGPVWFFAYFGAAGTAWDGVTPAGLACGQPIAISWDAVNNITVGLSDKLPGFLRFAWPVIANTNSYEVIIRNASVAGAPVVIRRNIRKPRTYFHEGDIWSLGALAGNVTYRWDVGAATGLQTITWPGSSTPARPQPKPAAVYPVGGQRLGKARNEFVWRMGSATEDRISRFTLTLTPTAPAGTPIVISDHVPYREADGAYRYVLPKLAGDVGFTDGMYSWTVVASDPHVSSVPSDTESFQVDLRNSVGGPFSIAGTIYQRGTQITNGTFVVQAFDNAGFGGVPLAQVRSSAATFPVYTLKGLPSGTYYVRAFLDQDGDGALGVYESWGFAAAVIGVYQFPGAIQLNSGIVGVVVELLHRDTDHDGLPDAWEMQFFGNLIAAGKVGSTGFTDGDGDRLSDLDEFNMGSNPRKADTDGDGLSDFAEATLPGAKMDPLNNDDDGDGVPTSIELAWAGLNPAAADTDGDGLSDLEEIGSGSNPTIAASTVPLHITSIASGGPTTVTVRWNLASNPRSLDGIYRVLSKGSLANWWEDWTELGAVNSTGDVTAPTNVTANTASGASGVFQLRFRLK